MAQIKRSNRRRDLSPVHPDAAAIDIGATMHVAAVSPERDPEPVRTFGTVTSELHRLADWFESCGIKTIAMESTGVYWIPAYEILEQRGFEVVLVNARDAKHVPGRKSDVSDAQWLQRLHECSGAASVRRGRSPHCGRICVSASACWITRPLTSSTCRRR
jgi:transposase